MTSKQELNLCQVSGEPHEIGYRLGEIARPLFVGDMAQSSAWLDVLHDRAPSGLPIYRDDPLDPDGENALATALFEIKHAGGSMKVYRQRQCAFDTFIARAAPGFESTDT